MVYGAIVRYPLHPLNPRGMTEKTKLKNATIAALIGGNSHHMTEPVCGLPNDAGRGIAVRRSRGV